MRIGIIGGSGLYEMEELTDIEHKDIMTPFGSPSDSYICGKLRGKEVCFLPRHGRGHCLLPAEINHRANICGMKMLDVNVVLSVSAVGSLKEELRPQDIVLPDQYFDRTKGSLKHTFFGEGVVAHIGFSEPTCSDLRDIIADVAEKVVEEQGDDVDVRINKGGTYVNMEGPAFSTKSESKFYRNFGFDIIGMTSLPEAKLCREAEICYQPLSMVTDYDCWHESEEPVTVEMVIGHLMANTLLAKKILAELVTAISDDRECSCFTALENAIMTSPEKIPDATREKLRVIAGKYM